MIKSKNFKIPIYGISFTAVLFETTKELKEQFKDSNISVDNFDGLVFEDDERYYVCFRKYIDGTQYPTPGIIAHEAKHLVNNIFIHIQCELNLFNDEPECYLLGYVVDILHAFINNRKN